MFNLVEHNNRPAYLSHSNEAPCESNFRTYIRASIYFPNSFEEVEYCPVINDSMINYGRLKENNIYKAMLNTDPNELTIFYKGVYEDLFTGRIRNTKTTLSDLNYLQADLRNSYNLNTRQARLNKEEEEELICRSYSPYFIMHRASEMRFMKEGKAIVPKDSEEFDKLLGDISVLKISNSSKFRGVLKRGLRNSILQTVLTVFSIKHIVELMNEGSPGLTVDIVKLEGRTTKDLFIDPKEWHLGYNIIEKPVQDPDQKFDLSLEEDFYRKYGLFASVRDQVETMLLNSKGRLAYVNTDYPTLHFGEDYRVYEFYKLFYKDSGFKPEPETNLIPF